MATQLDLTAPLAAPPRPAETRPVQPAPATTPPLTPPAQGGRVLVMDAFELLARLPEESVDLVLTDPPYQSLQLHRSRGTTTRLTSDWFTTIPDERLPELVEQVARVLKPDRHFYLFCDEVTADVIKQQQGIAAERMPNGGRKARAGLVYWKELIWAKTTGDGARIRGGTGYHYRASCERILFFEKGKRALNDLGIPDVLPAPRPQQRGPAAKPGAVIRTLIAQSTTPGELVVDPFCGTGVVGVESRAQSRRFLLGDIDLAYLDPQLADVAPPNLARAQRLEAPARAPPPLEQLLSAQAGALGDELHAAHAAGWLREGAATARLRELLAIRAVERRAALRRALRELPPRAEDPELLRAWRAWALHGKEE
jgi:site-specific DNA-methyltransferase (adenine-specific)